MAEPLAMLFLCLTLICEGVCFYVGYQVGKKKRDAYWRDVAGRMWCFAFEMCGREPPEQEELDAFEEKLIADGRLPRNGGGA